MFSIHTLDSGNVPGIILLGADDATYKIGQALVLSAGHLVNCSGAVKPQYISVQSVKITTDGDKLAVIPVSAGTVYSTTFSAANASVALGDKVTIASDGLRVTATESDGVATVVYKESDASGAVARVRFD